ncbi:MAG: carbon-nitrogen family hydrolase [Candidatus Altiarchaeota archaeon]
MNVACVQLDVVWEEPSENIAHAGELIKEAVKSGADLVCLPELFSTGVTRTPKKFAESLDGPTCSFLFKKAREHGIYLVGSYIQKNPAGLPRNSVVAYDPKGSAVCRYYKNRLFTYDREHRYYSPGKGVVAFKACGFTVSPFICYDLRFPELFRAAVGKGADMFIVAANWPNPRKEHWVTLLKARAIENQAYVVGVNRVGNSPKHSFFGGSMIVSPKGEVVAEAGDGEEVLIGEAKSDEIASWRREFPTLKDRLIFH